MGCLVSHVMTVLAGATLLCAQPAQGAEPRLPVRCGDRNSPLEAFARPLVLEAIPTKFTATVQASGGQACRSSAIVHYDPWMARVSLEGTSSEVLPLSLLAEGLCRRLICRPQGSGTEARLQVDLRAEPDRAARVERMRRRRAQLVGRLLVSLDYSRLEAALPDSLPELRFEVQP